jgi:hypothetical protein
MLNKIMCFFSFFIMMPSSLLLYFLTKDVNHLLIAVGTALVALGMYRVY